MLYAKYIKDAMDCTIVQAENTLWYLEPEWKSIMLSNGLGSPDAVTDYAFDGWNEVRDILKLEVEKRNTISDNKRDVIDWVYETITQTIQPAMLQEETEFLKNFIDYKKATAE